MAEEEQQVNEQIRNMYKIFDFEPNTAQNFGMFVDDGSDSGSSGRADDVA